MKYSSVILSLAHLDLHQLLLIFRLLYPAVMNGHFVPTIPRCITFEMLMPFSSPGAKDSVGKDIAALAIWQTYLSASKFSTIIPVHTHYVN